MHFTFTFGHERVELYLYSPYGPYGLYRASVPVQGCPLPLPNKRHGRENVRTLTIVSELNWHLLIRTASHRSNVSLGASLLLCIIFQPQASTEGVWSRCGYEHTLYRGRQDVKLRALHRDWYWRVSNYLRNEHNSHFICDIPVTPVFM